VFFPNKANTAQLRSFVHRFVRSVGRSLFFLLHGIFLVQRYIVNTTRRAGNETGKNSQQQPIDLEEQ